MARGYGGNWVVLINFTGVQLENYNLCVIQRVIQRTIGLIEEGNMANNTVYSGGSGPVGFRSCASQGSTFPIRSGNKGYGFDLENGVELGDCR